MLRAKEDARSLISFRQKRPYEGINNKDVLLLLFGLIRININNKKMECAHCHNPQAGNLEPITQRAFCNAECQRALYVKGGIFDIVATRKRTISRDVVYRLMKEYTKDKTGEYDRRKLPMSLVHNLCLMHRESVPFANDHIDKVYYFFFDQSNAQALRHDFLWHQDELKQACMGSSSQIGSELNPCAEIFVKLYDMGSFVNIQYSDFLEQHFRRWYSVGSKEVCEIFLKDQVINASYSGITQIIVQTIISENDANLFLNIIGSTRIHVNNVIGMLERISNLDIFTKPHEWMLSTFENFIRDPRIINNISSSIVEKAYVFTSSRGNIETTKYILMYLNPPNGTVLSHLNFLMYAYDSDPNEGSLMAIQKILSTNKVDLTGFQYQAASPKLYDIFITYQRARERGQGESSRKYTRMGKRL